MSDDTIFDKIIRKEIPSDVVYEDDDVFAFRDIDPQAPVHVLVLPKRKVRDVNELGTKDPEEVGRFLIGVAKVADSLGLSGGYRTVMNTGKDAQQSVPYLHAHILAGRPLSWPPG